MNSFITSRATPDMTRQPPRDATRLIILAGCLLLLSGCITRWPDAPYLDAAASLDAQTAGALEQKHPGAKLVSPVYRRHMENAQGRYQIVSRVFLFEDAKGDAHRGHVAEDGQLNVANVVFVDALPKALHDRLFDGASAIAAGGQLRGKAWRFHDRQMGTEMHEFEFIHDGQRGLGRVAESNALASAEMIRQVEE